MRADIVISSNNLNSYKADVTTFTLGNNDVTVKEVIPPEFDGAKMDILNTKNKIMHSSIIPNAFSFDKTNDYHIQFTFYMN